MDCAYTRHIVPCIYSVFFGHLFPHHCFAATMLTVVCSVPIFQLVWSAAVLRAQFHFTEQKRNNNSSTFTELRVAIKIHVPNQRSQQSSAQKTLANSSNLTIAIRCWTFHEMNSEKHQDCQSVVFFAVVRFSSMNWISQLYVEDSNFDELGEKSGMCHTNDDEFHFRKTVSFLHDIDFFRSLYRIQLLGSRECVCVYRHTHTSARNIHASHTTTPRSVV